MHPKKVHYSLRGKATSQPSSDDGNAGSSNHNLGHDDGSSTHGNDSKSLDKEDGNAYNDGGIFSDNLSLYSEDTKKPPPKQKFDKFATTCYFDKEYAMENIVHNKTTLAINFPSQESHNKSLSLAMNSTSEYVVLALQDDLDKKNTINTEMQKEIKKLRKTVSRLQKEKSILRANIAAYNVSSQVGCIPPSSSPHPSTQKECISSATEFVHTLCCFPTKSRQPGTTAVEKLSLQVMDIL
ncbi:hypothetical protein ACA910_022635 [Epithemia clementina (nom. ined.)]